MNKIVLFTYVFLLTGCGVKYPETANLNLRVPSQSAAVYANSTVFVHGQDARENPEVIVYKVKKVIVYKVKKEPVVKVPNLNAPLIVITERLTGGLREQGMQFESNSPVRIELKLNQLLATITKPKRLYSVEAVSRITLKAINGKKSLTKKYNHQDDLKSVFRPKIAEIENMLNNQLSDIVTQILSDMQLQELIIKK